jgi:hypothetical protein
MYHRPLTNTSSLKIAAAYCTPILNYTMFSKSRQCCYVNDKLYVDSLYPI